MRLAWEARSPTTSPRAAASAIAGMVIPEPSTFVLAGFGLIAVGLVGARRRRKK